MARTRVFVSYSHKDAKWSEELKTHLGPLKGSLDLWDDARIAAGACWREELEAALRSAKLALLLVSPDFLVSRFINEHELPVLLASAQSSGLRVLRLHLRHSLLAGEAPLSDALQRLRAFQALDDPGKPLADLEKRKREKALVAIAEKIFAAARADDGLVDPRPYLERLHEQTRWIEVRGIGAKAAERVELQRAYTRLRVVALGRQREHEARQRGRTREPLTASDELRASGRDASGRDSHDPLRSSEPDLSVPRRAGEHELVGDPGLRDLDLSDLLREHAHHLVLVGDPGAGKTTFLRFVALNLTRALLSDDPQAGLDALGLRGTPPFPILVRLADFDRFLTTGASSGHPPGCAEQFRLYLDFLSRGLPAGLPASFLRERLSAGGCLLLLDGLDEVPGDAARARVGAILDAVVAEGSRVHNRHVVTCRTRAYQGRVQLSAEFTRASLVDFADEQVEEFVAEWSRALHRVVPGDTTSPAAEAAATHERELLAAIRAHPHVRPLTANPLLLTILAVVHWNRKKLPEQRADLYEAAIDYLLESRVEQSPHESTLRRDCLMAVARALFDGQGEVRKTLGRSEAAAVVAPLLRIEPKAAVAFIEDEELHSGILVSRIEGEVEFWHPTFGEYLAAASLAWEDYWEHVRGHLFEERWSEVVLLLAGCLRRGGLRPAGKFIEKILAMDASPPGLARPVALVGRILRDILPAGGDPAAGTGYAEARQRVLAIFEKGSNVAERVRIEVGEALGQAGDPRIQDDDHANRVFIKGGSFWMGAQKESQGQSGYDPLCRPERESPVHRVTVSDFWIDRYPVTVAQYRRFVDAGEAGYMASRFWQREGWQWRQQQNLSGPRKWGEQLQHLNRPVTWVSWYEADAYCAWLSATVKRAVSLPTEAQWEYAARGAESRRFPWGNDEPTDRHANFGMHVAKPTPVGIYPLGATLEGVQDLAGNAWEWCLDWFGSYSTAEHRDPPGPRDGSERLLRGGGFSHAAMYCRSAYRGYDLPRYNSVIVRFRCVVSDSGGQRD